MLVTQNKDHISKPPLQLAVANETLTEVLCSRFLKTADMQPLPNFLLHLFVYSDTGNAENVTFF